MVAKENKKEQIREKRRKEYKTDTIMRRAVLVYLPTIEMKNKWKEKAEKSGLSISKFIIEHVENSLNQEENSEFLGSRADLIKRVKELEEEKKELEAKYDLLSRAYDRLEEENRRYRTMPFFEEIETFRQYETKLIQIFKKKGKIMKGDIFELLRIDPMKETNVVKGINRQLENLERYDLIEDKGRYWLWKG